MTEKSFTEPTDDSVRENLLRIRQTMADACAAAGRPESDVSLLAVTKTVEPARINRAISLGVGQIGENRVQEFLGKRDSLHLDGVGVHLIGHLQTNKVAQIVGLVDCIESIDSLRVGPRRQRRLDENRADHRRACGSEHRQGRGQVRRSPRRIGAPFGTNFLFPRYPRARTDDRSPYFGDRTGKKTGFFANAATVY